MSAFFGVTLTDELARQVEEMMKNSKRWLSKSALLREAVEKGLKRMRDEEMKYVR